MPTTTLTGTTLPLGTTSAYGSIPATTSPVSNANTAITGNLSNLSDLYTLAGNLNTFNNSAALSNLSSNLPGYSGMVNQSSQNILDNLSGIVSQGVTNQISQVGAERGVSGGFGVDSGNTNSAILRALGLTSMQLQQTGETQLTNAINRTPTGQLFNTSSMLTTPADVNAAQDTANVRASSPDPTLAALTNSSALTSGTNTGLSSIGSSGAGNQGSSNSLDSLLRQLGINTGSGSNNNGYAIGYGSGTTGGSSGSGFSGTLEPGLTYGLGGDQTDMYGFSADDYASAGPVNSGSQYSDAEFNFDYGSQDYYGGEEGY